MRETLAGKTYAVLLRCPMQDQDAWVVLHNRTETIDQILAMPCDFECPLHGVQRELPVAANENGPPAETRPRAHPMGPQQGLRRPEKPKPAAAADPAGEKRSSARMSVKVAVRVYGWVRSKGAFHEETSTLKLNSGGCLVALSAKVELGDMLFVVNKVTNQELECRVAYVEQVLHDKAKVGLAFKTRTENFWNNSRPHPRIAKSILVRVRGVDRKGDPFSQTAYTVDISEKGARLDGVGSITEGETVELKRGWNKARYRVVWIGPPGTPQANQVGICCMEDNKNIWGGDFPAPPKPKK